MITNKITSMKRIFFAALLIAAATTGFAQSEKYMKAMTQNLALLDSAKTTENFTSLAGNFERIANAEKTEWLPLYYAAFCHITGGFLLPQGSGDRQEEIATIVDDLLARADAMVKDNSEMHCLLSMAATLRLMANPMKNYMTYGPKANEHIAKAMQLDAGNPRPYLLEGQQKFYTPEQFGGDKAKAMELFKKAMELYGSFKPASPIHPTWGKNQVEMMMKMGK